MYTQPTSRIKVTKTVSRIDQKNMHKYKCSLNKKTSDKNIEMKLKY